MRDEGEWRCHQQSIHRRTTQSAQARREVTEVACYPKLGSVNQLPDLEITLVCVEDNRCFGIVSALQLNSSKVNGGLKVRMLCIYHQTHACTSSCLCTPMQALHCSMQAFQLPHCQLRLEPAGGSMCSIRLSLPWARLALLQANM